MLEYACLSVCVNECVNEEVGSSSGGRALSCKGLDPPTWLMHLQFGLFSIPTRGPEQVHQRLWCVLSCLWESTNKRSHAGYQKEVTCGDSWFPL